MNDDRSEERQVEAVLRLVERFPWIGEFIEENSDEDGILAHMVMGDVVRWLLELCKSGTPQALAEIDAVMAFGEQEWATGDEDVQNLWFVSFVENFWGAEEECPGILDRLGPQLRREYASLSTWTPEHEAAQKWWEAYEASFLK